MPSNHCVGVGRGWCACDDESTPGCFWPGCAMDVDCEKYGPGAYCSTGFCSSLSEFGSGAACEDGSWCNSGECVGGRCSGAGDTPLDGLCEDTSWCRPANAGFSPHLCCFAAETGDDKVCTDTMGSLDACRKRLGESCSYNFECISRRCSGACY